MFNHQVMFIHLHTGGEGLRPVEGVHAAHFGQVGGAGNEWGESDLKPQKMSIGH